jgi:hypothetical protein
MICPLTPQLLEKWVDSAAASSPRAMTRDNCSSSFRLSIEAHVRLIAALDKNIPYWPGTNHKLWRVDECVRQFDLTLAHVAREAGGQIGVAEAYRKLSQPRGRDYHRLTVEGFLHMLPSVECTVIEFEDPEIPIVRLRPSSAGVLVSEVPGQNGKPSTAPKIHSNSPAIQLFEPKPAFCERHAVARR